MYVCMYACMYVYVCMYVCMSYLRVKVFLCYFSFLLFLHRHLARRIRQSVIIIMLYKLGCFTRPPTPLLHGKKNKKQNKTILKELKSDFFTFIGWWSQWAELKFHEERSDHWLHYPMTVKKSNFNSDIYTLPLDHFCAQIVVVRWNLCKLELTEDLTIAPL